MNLEQVVIGVCEASQYIDFAEAARVLEISRYKLKQKCAQGKIPYKVFGSRTFFLKTDIEQAMKPINMEDEFKMDDVLRELVQLFRENRRLRAELEEITEFSSDPRRLPYVSDLIDRASEIFKDTQ